MADEPTPTPTPEPEPAPDPAPAPPAFAPVTSQEQFDQMVKDRLARERGKYADYDELKAAKERLDKIEEANATELEKAQKRAEDAEKVATAALAQAQATALRAAIIAEAARPGRNIADVEATFGFLTGIDQELVELDADGNPKDIAKAVDSLLERRPILVAQNGGARPGGADQGARGKPADDQLTTEALKGMSPEAVRNALREGKLDTALKGG